MKHNDRKDIKVSWQLQMIATTSLSFFFSNRVFTAGATLWQWSARWWARRSTPWRPRRDLHSRAPMFRHQEQAQITTQNKKISQEISLRRRGAASSCCCTRWAGPKPVSHLHRETTINSKEMWTNLTNSVWICLDELRGWLKWKTTDTCQVPTADKHRPGSLQATRVHSWVWLDSI